MGGGGEEKEPRGKHGEETRNLMKKFKNILKYLVFFVYLFLRIIIILA